jgi:1-acyl-sn-glycerol-3-phosphate acyltransferase
LPAFKNTIRGNSITLKKSPRQHAYSQNRNLPAKNERVFRAIKLLGRVLLTPFFRIEVAGAKYLPVDRAFILLSKHHRWADIPLLSIATPRPLYYIAKYELFRNALSRWFCSALGGIPLNRQRPLESRHALNATIALLEKGEAVVIFPEGTYYRGQMGPGQIGMVRFVLSRLKIPFIPVGINYTASGWRVGVRIHFGKASYPEPASPLNPFFNDLMAQIAHLSGLPPNLG